MPARGLTRRAAARRAAAFQRIVRSLATVCCSEVSARCVASAGAGVRGVASRSDRGRRSLDGNVCARHIQQRTQSQLQLEADAIRNVVREPTPVDAALWRCIDQENTGLQCGHWPARTASEDTAAALQAGDARL